VEVPSGVGREGHGMPIDHPEVETPSGVTEAGQKADQTTRPPQRSL